MDWNRIKMESQYITRSGCGRDDNMGELQAIWDCTARQDGRSWRHPRRGINDLGYGHQRVCSLFFDSDETLDPPRIDMLRRALRR